MIDRLGSRRAASGFLESHYGVSMKQYDENEPLFITDEIEAELTAAGYEFEAPGHARTASIRELFGWQPGESLAEAINRLQGKPSSP